MTRRTHPVKEDGTQEKRSGRTLGSRKEPSGKRSNCLRPPGKRNSEHKMINRRTGNHVDTAIAPSSTPGRSATPAVRSIAAAVAGIGEDVLVSQNLYLFQIVLDHHDRFFYKKTENKC